MSPHYLTHLKSRATRTAPVFLLSAAYTKAAGGNDMTPETVRATEEYSALRATIRERGTTRMCVFSGGLVGWGALTVATAALASTPLATFLPLVVLASVFEAVYALHIGVERIGRYIQAFHESPQAPGWEHIAMAFGRPKGAAAIDALFTVPFLVATIVNAAPALYFQPTMPEMVFVGGGHALFLVRLFSARATAARQRTIELARFEEMKRTQ
jgi:hypothetical protein